MDSLLVICSSLNDFNKEQTLKELNAQTVITTEFGREAPKAAAEFSKDQIKRIASDPNLTPEEKITEQQKWAEGGVYRVALHTAVGAIGTGTIEGAVTTGGIAASAPIIDKLSEQVTEQLVKAGISEDTAQNATSLITSLAIATATQSAGVDTSSTVMAVNTDVNNRQLHKQEIDILKAEAKKLAQKQGITDNEAYSILYAWVYSQLDTKANNELSSYLAYMKELQSPLTPYSTESYHKLIGNLQEADRIYQSLVSKHGGQKIETAKKDSQGNDIYLFKANAHQQNQANLFGKSTNYQGGIVGGIDLDGSGALNNQAQANYKAYFDGKIKSYQASKTSVSGEVYPVYPEDWIGGATLVGKGAVKLTGASLKNLGGKGVSGANTKKVDQPTITQAKATCTNGISCFTAGTLIETSRGLKAIETFTGGELIWTRNDITLEYGYRPVIATKATPDQPIFQVTVKNHQGDIETLETTAEHPFWIKDTGWLKASLLEQGMILLDRNNQEVEVISQYLLPNHTDTVYNIEVDDFHTYHVGRLGVWVHNADC
ncbi:polymorphic toxin-type HINT domain-containing protein, partial [Moraxella caprae]